MEEQTSEESASAEVRRGEFLGIKQRLHESKLLWIQMCSGLIKKVRIENFLCSKDLHHVTKNQTPAVFITTDTFHS